MVNVDGDDADDDDDDDNSESGVSDDVGIGVYDIATFDDDDDNVDFDNVVLFTDGVTRFG